MDISKVKKSLENSGIAGVRVMADGHHYTENSKIGSVYWLTEVM